MNVTHIIDELREKYKDHEDYYTRVEILNDIKLNKKKSLWYDIDISIVDGVDDFFGISPFFIFVEKGLIVSLPDEEFIESNCHPSFKPFEKTRRGTYGGLYCKHYIVHSLIPQIKKTFFSSSFNFKKIKSEYSKSFDLNFFNENKRSPIGKFKYNNRGKYETNVLFYSFLLNSENENVLFPSHGIHGFHSNRGMYINELKYDDDKKKFIYKVLTNYDFENFKIFKPRIEGTTKYELSKFSVEDLTNKSFKSSEFWKDFINECKEEFELKTQSKEQSILYNKNELVSSIDDFILSFDSDQNNKIDIFEQDTGFNKLLKKHQNKIIEIDKNFIQNLIRLDNYITKKKSNTIKLFNLIKRQLKGYKKIELKSFENDKEKELKEEIRFFKFSFEQSIQTYRLLVLHSLSMITSIVKEDMITFYKIYEELDKLGIFNSSHENEVEDRMKTIQSELNELINSTYDMERNIVKRLDKLTYVTENSFKKLNKSVTTELKDINSTLKFNNLLTSIQTYQTYKINKNTKSLRK